MKQDDLIWLIVIEESANDAEVILNSLRKARYPIRPRHVEDAEDLQQALTEHQWDLIISVPQVGDFTLAEVCELVASSKQDIPVIALVNKLEVKVVTELLQSGARQVIPGGNDNCLQTVVGRELENLTERRKRKFFEQLYKDSQAHNKMLLASSRDAIAYVQDGMHVNANPSYLEMFNYKKEDIEGLPVMDLFVLDDQVKFKDFMRDFMADDKNEEGQIKLEGIKSNKKRFKINLQVSKAIYDSERCIQIIVRDQSQNEEAAEEYARKLKEASQRDQLTSLFNRPHFLKLLEKALAKAIEVNTRSVLLYISLDNFAVLKERIGVTSTDDVVKNIGHLYNSLSEGGILGRFEESSFTLLLADKDVKHASELADKICKATEACVTEVGSQSVITTCSIGIALVLASSANAQDVLMDAHAACREAAKRGNTYEVYKAVMKSGDQGGTKITDIAKMIETAIEEKRLSLRYQPIVSLRGETQEIYEVYLRMVDSNGQFIPAGQLFAAAEKANLTIHLDKWVLQEAVKVLMRRHLDGHQTHFFIKLSDQAIKDENVLLYIRKLLKATQLPGERLVIEVSESIAIGQVKLAKAFITSLKNLNCQSALEHFGTGLNSSTTLKHIPVDYVKIDSSYSRGLSINVENQKAVEEIVKIAREQGKITIAEAVEDANSLTVLWQCEVDFAQGHYIQEPTEELSYDFTEEG